MPFQLKRALFWRLRVARSSKTFLGLSWNFPIFLLDFNQILDFLDGFSWVPDIKFLVNLSSVSRADTEGSTDGRTTWYHFSRSGRSYGHLISPVTVKRTEVFTKSIWYFCPILTKFWFSRHVFMKVPNMKSHRNLSSDSRADTCGQTDWRTWWRYNAVFSSTWPRLKRERKGRKKNSCTPTPETVGDK
jgi:hypothetical protein